MEEFPQISGKLFRQVQENAVFADSKTFVDCTPVESPQKIINEFENLEPFSRESLREFVEKYFRIPESRSIDSIEAHSTRDYIEKSWDVFTRQPDEENPRSSLIPLKNSYVVPGGRFREIYYWDTYFSILGLLVSGEKQKALDNYRNLLDLVEQFGFIPNGNRKYYLSRSQPPTLSLTFKAMKENDIEIDRQFSREMLETELDYWKDGKKQVKVNGNLVYRYYDQDNEPRPESYREDVETAEESDNIEIFRDLRSGAESGWDFSSRWTNGKRLEDIRTTEIIPVDLNCMIYGLETEIDESSDLENTIDKLFWNNEKGFYFDYDNENNCQTGIWSLAGVLPLHYELSNEEQAEKVKETLEEGFLEKGGLKTTLSRTGMQWDAPNGWAPLHWFAVKGLQNYGYDELAKEIARKWVQTCREGFRRNGTLMEKYNVVKPEKNAQDGEYEVQKGFGWTNGVTISFMNEFGL